MKTRRPPHPQQESDQLATPKVQTRSWGQGAGERSQPQPVAYDLSQVDLFSHAPQRPSVQTKLAIAPPTEKYRQDGDLAAVNGMSIRDSTNQQAIKPAPTSTIQRALGITVDQYKTASGGSGSGPRNRVRAIDQALADYHRNVPSDRLGPKSNASMTPDELRTIRQLLDNLMVEIDTYLAYNNIAQKRRQGTYALRVAVQDQRMQVTKALVQKDEFSTDGMTNKLPEGVKTDASSFIHWLEGHPEYLQWAGQGAGACITSAQSLEKFLEGTFPDVRVRGILAFATSDRAKVANHFVILVRIAGEEIVVDPTQIQFLGGNPQIAREATWRQRLRTVQIAFPGSAYEPAQAVKIKDFDNCADALEFAGDKRRLTVQLRDVAGEADL